MIFAYSDALRREHGRLVSSIGLVERIYPLIIHTTTVSGSKDRSEKLRHHNTMKKFGMNSRAGFLTAGAVAVVITAIVFSINGAANTAKAQDGLAGGNRPSEMDEPISALEGYRRAGYPAFSRASKRVQLSFTVRGAIDQILVHETDRVAPGQVLMTLKSDLQKWTVEGQRILAEDTTQLESAKGTRDVAKYDLESLQAVEDSASPRELVHAKADYTSAEINIRAAESNRKQAHAAYEREKARLDEMTLRSPIAGEVVRIDVEKGEAVEELKPIVQLVNVDTLWMDIAVPIQLGLRLKKGMSAIVHWRDVERGKPVDATVKFVLPVADAMSNQIVARIEFTNTKHLPAGLHALVQFPEAEDAWLKAEGRGKPRP